MKKFTSHRNCKDKSFGSKSVNSYFVRIFPCNRREKLQNLFALSHGALSQKEKKSINSFKSLGTVYEASRGKQVECIQQNT